MREFPFPSCSGERGVLVADVSGGGAAGGKQTQNLVTCVYRAELAGRRTFFVTVTWSRTATAHGFAMEIEDLAGDLVGKIDVKPWFFSKKKGCRTLAAIADGKIEVFWDLSAARYGGGPEPAAAFYLAVVFNLEMVLLLGDQSREAYLRSRAGAAGAAAACVFREEQLFGKKAFSTAARFSMAGKLHEICIECDAAAAAPELALEIRVDRRRAVQVERLAWKFRGNQTILVDGVPVEVYWDVHRWLFGGNAAAAVFLFRCSAAGEKWLPAPEKKQQRPAGFSLVLHAWRTG